VVFLQDEHNIDPVHLNNKVYVYSEQNGWNVLWTSPLSQFLSLIHMNFIFYLKTLQ